MEENLISIGECRCCHQTQTLNAPVTTIEAADEAATMLCSCPQGQIVRLKSLWRWHRTLCRKCRREADYPCRGCGEIALVKALAAENKRLRETINLMTVKKALQNAGTLDPADLPFQEVLDECKQ